jgi:purine-binding chemotaxis protein CheW
MNSSQAIDWKEIHRRLGAVRDAIERGATPSAETRKAILRNRAQILATEPEKLPGEQIEFVEFLLAHERYGIESSWVREVYPLKEFTPLPGMPPFILGIINVRGQIISITDIKKFFDLPEKGITDLNKVIILHSPAMELGILADAVLAVRTVPLAEIQPPPSTFTGVRMEYLRGITRERTIILNAGKVLSDPKLIIQEEMKANSYEVHP